MSLLISFDLVLKYLLSLLSIGVIANEPPGSANGNNLRSEASSHPQGIVSEFIVEIHDINEVSVPEGHQRSIGDTTLVQFGGNRE